MKPTGPAKIPPEYRRERRRGLPSKKRAAAASKSEARRKRLRLAKIDTWA